MQVDDLLRWQRDLIGRLERAIGRELVEADLGCIAWNVTSGTLTVERPPLRDELKLHNLISNVFRTHQFARAGRD